MLTRPPWPRLVHSNVSVVKHSSALPTAEPMKWVVSSDDSDYSMKAIADTKALMSEGDTLTILFVTSGTVGMSKNGTAIDTFKLLKEKKYLQVTMYIRLGCRNPRGRGAELA